MTLTTHLVCAPDNLDGLYRVLAWQAWPGEQIEPDMPLVSLISANERIWIVAAPLGGVLAEHCVVEGDTLEANELLALIEAEEKPLGVNTLLGEDTGEETLSIAACLQGHRTDQSQRQIPVDLMALCAQLGLAPEEIGEPATLTIDAVYRHVRTELRLLATLRQMLGSKASN